MNPSLKLVLLSVGVAPAVALAAGQAHQHGIARLDIAVDATRITVQLESPLDNLLGYERAPHTDAERRQADALVARLKSADTLFRIDPAAQCRLDKVELASAALRLGQADPSEQGHADIDGSFEFRCVDAAKAAFIEVGLFEYRSLQRLEVQVASSRGQFRRDLKRPQARIALTK